MLRDAAVISKLLVLYIYGCPDDAKCLPDIHRASFFLSWHQPHSDRPPYGTSVCYSLQIAHDNLDTHKAFPLERDAHEFEHEKHSDI